MSNGDNQKRSRLRAWDDRTTLGEVMHWTSAFSFVVLMNAIGDPKGNIIDLLTGSIVLAGFWEMFKVALCTVTLANLTSRGGRE